MLKHGENIVDLLGAEVDRIENELKVSCVSSAYAMSACVSFSLTRVSLCLATATSTTSATCRPGSALNFGAVFGTLYTVRLLPPICPVFTCTHSTPFVNRIHYFVSLFRLVTDSTTACSCPLFNGCGKDPILCSFLSPHSPRLFVYSCILSQSIAILFTGNHSLR